MCCGAAGAHTDACLGETDATLPHQLDLEARVRAFLCTFCSVVSVSECFCVIERASFIRSEREEGTASSPVAAAC